MEKNTKRAYDPVVWVPDMGSVKNCIIITTLEIRNLIMNNEVLLKSLAKIGILPWAKFPGIKKTRW